MRMAIVAGPPSTGKTSIITHALGELAEDGTAPIVVKFDCLVSDDADWYAQHGIKAISGFSAGQCPDHFFASNIPDAFAWARDQGTDFLIAESAGLCNRCSPFIAGVPAICVIDCLAGLRSPKKIGPLLKMADLIVLSKGDMISQAEREVFAFSVQALAPKAELIFANGLTGQGAKEVAGFLRSGGEVDGLDERELRFSMPSALCSYCLGDRRLGSEHQMGNVRRMEFE